LNFNDGNETAIQGCILNKGNEKVGAVEKAEASGFSFSVCYLHNNTPYGTNINKYKNKYSKFEIILKISTINVLKSIINQDVFLC
jgi:hypothetical protein